jgi:hypothetical protein
MSHQHRRKRTQHAGKPEENRQDDVQDQILTTSPDVGDSGREEDGKEAQQDVSADSGALGPSFDWVIRVAGEVFAVLRAGAVAG